MKACAWCGGVFNPRRKDAGFCSRRCSKAKSASSWRESNREKHRAYSSKYYANNTDAHKAGCQAWAAENKEKVQQSRQRWRSANPTTDAASKRMWERRNPEYGAAKSAKRRAAARQAVPKWHGELEEFLMQEIYHARKMLSAATGVEHHVDHEVPLVSDIVCGLHTPNNLRVVPASVNLSKGNKLEVSE